MTTKEILVKARSLIELPAAWSGPDDHTPDAQRCFCAATAIWQAADPFKDKFATSSREAVPAGDALAKAAGVRLPSSYGDPTGRWNSIYDWNDHTTHDKVLSAFDEAIEAQS